MKHGMMVILTVGLVLGPMRLWAQAPATGELKDEKAKMSYSIGMNIGNSIKRGMVELDVDVLASAIKDVLAERALKLTDQQASEAWAAYNTAARTRREEDRKKTAEKNRKAAEEYLAANKSKAGVKVHPVTMPDGTTVEMQYKVLTEGGGAIPKSNDMVTVNYRGTQLSGKEFDSTAKRGQPDKRPINRFPYRGLTEALQQMKAGSKWEVYLPPALALGDYGGPSVEPGSALIFELELVAAETPAPPAPPQPLTSDIIRVPSAEELKAGAKVEVLKAEDVEKQIKAAAEKEKAEKEKAEKEKAEKDKK